MSDKFTVALSDLESRYVTIYRDSICAVTEPIRIKMNYNWFMRILLMCVNEDYWTCRAYMKGGHVFEFDRENYEDIKHVCAELLGEPT